MSRKSRIFRALSILLALLVVAGFGAFSTFLFNPFEGGLGVDVSGLVVRDVHFFIARSELRRSFDGFPKLAIEADLQQNEAWQTFSHSPEKEALWEELGILEIDQQLRDIASQIPLGIEPLDLFGGRDLAIAGHLNGPELAQADWAAYGLMNWAGKGFFELVRYPGLIGLPEQGILATVEDDWVMLSGGQLTRDLYLARIKDVGIVATSAAPIVAAKERQESGYENSMLQRAEYEDFVRVEARSVLGDELELWIDFRDLFENLRSSGAWPDPNGESFVSRIFGRYFQANLLNHLVGFLGTHFGLTLNLRGQLSSELMTPLQERAYRYSGADVGELRREAANLVPADAGLFVYLKADVGEFLHQVLESMDPATRELLSEAFRKTGKYSDIEQVVGVLDTAFWGRMAFIMRANDYASDPDGPPHDDAPVPSMALVTWIKDGKSKEIEALRDTIGHNPTIFGLVGKTPEEPGYYRNEESGYETREFWNPLIPGTGAMATAIAGELFIVTNSHRMLAHVIRTWTTGAPDFPRLSERDDFEGLLSTSLHESNLLVWANPRPFAKTMRLMALRHARDSIFIDWKAERGKAERDVIRSKFPDQAAAHQRGQLPEAVRLELDAEVDQILDQRQLEIYETRVPVIQARYERRIQYLELISAGLLMLSLDRKHMDLSARIVAPLGR